MTTEQFYRFGLALIIGILAGLQREYAYDDDRSRELFAGVRTFALISLSGYVAALLSDVLDSALPFAGIILVLGGFITVAYYMEARTGEMGLTTEVATLLIFLVGAMTYWGYMALAAALAVTMTVLLSVKRETQRFVERLTREDIYATLKFAVISAVVLPVLPNQTYGPPPVDVLNPYKIWLMVVFISGISFLGYVLIKAVGARQGIGLTGLLGGIASSTAVTLSFTERSRNTPSLANSFSLAIIVAWTVMFVRVLVVVFALNAELARRLLVPLGAAMLSGLVYCIYLYFNQRPSQQEEVNFSNPFELGPAIKFGLLYAFILVISKAAQVYFGNTGIYISSVVSGMADVDAIALSMVELAQDPNGVSLPVATRAVVLAALSNTAFKGGFALTTGSKTLRKVLLPGMLIILVTGAIVAFIL